MSIRSLSLAAVIALGALASSAVAGDTVKPGKWRIGDEPKGWVLYSTEHYQVQSRIPKDRAKIVSDRLEKMMVEYRKRFPIRKPLKDFVLKIFANRKEYVGYGGSPGSAAYYTPTHQELVCFDTGLLSAHDAKEISPEDEERLKERLKGTGLSEEEIAENADLMAAMRKLSTMNLLGILSHEGWHQYFHFYIVSQVEFPSWLDEGMGDYFYSARLAPDAKSIVLGDFNAARFPIIYRALKKDEYVPVKELIRYRQRDYYKDPGLCYAEGWSLVYFCLHSGNETYAKIPEKLIKVFKDKHDMDEATDEAFARIDLEKFEEEWKRFYLDLDFAKTMIDLAKTLSGQSTLPAQR